MPTREKTIIDTIKIFENSRYPEGFNVSTAWLGVYQTLLWFEEINHLSYDHLPHIIDADKLRPANKKRKESWISPSIWQKRADLVKHYLSDCLLVDKQSVHTYFDRLMREQSYIGLQRQNSLGIAFIGLTKHIINLFGPQDLSIELEKNAAEIFRGITFPGRSVAPRIDIVGFWDDLPCLIISGKWSIRHDRLSDITNECPIYKSAYERIHRGSVRSKLLYYVITNEYDPSRLSKLLKDPCIDGVVHVHKKCVVEICELDDRLNNLFDLVDFITLLSKL